MTAHDHVDATLGPFVDADHAGQRILGIANPDIDDRDAAQCAPKPRLQHAPILDEQILIESRSAHAMDGQGCGPDKRVWNLMFRKDDGNALEQRHNVSASFDREGSLPTARARLNTRRASVSLTPCAAR